MSHTMMISNFPAHRLDDARHALALAYARIQRAAERSGQAAPDAPTIAVAAERIEIRCARCRTQGMTGGGKECHCGGKIRAFHVLDLELTAARPALDGWEFLAVVEPLDGGNLIRQVPGATITDGELDAWRTGEIVCDHCTAKRRRLETFIVRADGSDPAIAAGTYKQVGRNCLAAFLGGKSAAAIVSSVGFPDLLRGFMGDSEEGGTFGGGNVPDVYMPIEFMAWTAAICRLDGYTSKSKAREANAAGGSKSATADDARWLIDYVPHRSPEERADWEKARKKYEPTTADSTIATDAIAWAKALPGASDYERNLSLVARQIALQGSHTGILASAIPAMFRARGEQMKRERTAANIATSVSTHLGAIGDKKVAFGTVTIERVTVIDTDFGPLHIHSMRDAAGNMIVWKTGKGHGSVGDVKTLVGTIKAHSEFRGEKQTELARCKITGVQS